VTMPLLVISVPGVVSIERMPLAPAPLTLTVPRLTIVLLLPRASSPWPRAPVVATRPLLVIVSPLRPGRTESPNALKPDVRTVP